MSFVESISSTQRDKTDASLRSEREQADGVFADTQSSDEQKADCEVRRSRENSDAVLNAARERADLRMEHVAALHVASNISLLEERQVEDRRVQRSRDIADAALNYARDKADLLLEEAASQAAVSTASIAAERALEDKIRRNERASVDGTLRRERDDNARALSKLLPLERENTDRDLLTERVRSDAAVASRDDFLAMVSHDLRSLLGGIVMFTDLLASNAPDGDTGHATRTDTANIQRYAARMNRLIGDLVDVVSIDAGKLSVVCTPCSATDVVSEAVASFEATAAAKGISLTGEVSTTPLHAELDCERILQVLANLISNAMKFTQSGGSIRVCAEPSGDHVRFSVHDNGSGIQGDGLEHIFQRFWQAGRDDRRGLGLGLYISRCIVEAHGGRIWAESELGAGTTIHFDVPASSYVASGIDPSSLSSVIG